ncbi:MAG: Mut7-C RNAse domain-containing protein [Bacteroidota bacterium]
MKFAVDKMLGRLAKWLRILGYDTLFDPYVSSATIAKQAEEERRIFLTRNDKLTKHSDTPSFFIVQSENYREQLREVVGHFQLDTSSHLFTRCTICNKEILPVEKDMVKDRIPEKSALNFEKFYQCPQCKRVYWGGTHTQNTERRLREILS